MRACNAFDIDYSTCVKGKVNEMENAMRNLLTANVVELNMSAFAERKPAWRATVINYEGVSPTSGYLLIWDAKQRRTIEYRPCEIGTAEECKAIAARWNGQLGA